MLGGVEVKAKTAESICRPLTGKGFNKREMGRFTHLKGLSLADNFESNEKPIDILIGGDYFYMFVGDKVIRGTYGPVAVETSFGYTLSGGIPPKNTHSLAHANLSFTCLNAASSSDNFEAKLSKFWSMEGLGVLRRIQ